MSLSRSFIDIHSACKRGDLEEVKRYLKAGGEIEKKKVPLFNPSSNAISPLISSHLSQDGHTPLTVACRYCHAEVALFLIEKGASINRQTNVRVASLISSHLSQNGDTPLIYACYKGLPEVALFLIEKGASIDHQDNVRVACP
jgi:ankyrin repeat protein